MIYPVDSVIHVSDDWGQGSHSVSQSVSQKPKREYSKKFSTGRLCPEVQPLTLLHIIVDRKDAPLVYLLLTNGTPFRDLAQTFATLLTAKNAAFKLWINHKTRLFSWLFTTIKCSPFGPFYIRRKWQISLPFNVLRLLKSLSFHMPKA